MNKKPEAPRTLSSLTSPQREDVQAVTAHLNKNGVMRGIEMKNEQAAREAAFRALVRVKLIEQFEDNLDEAHFTESEATQAKDAFLDMDDENTLQALSLPSVLRKGRFAALKAKIDRKELSPEDIPGELLRNARDGGFSIGYHSSPIEIRPTKEGWFVRPTQQDHRDSDLTMAYCATTYATLYRKGHPKHLYVVRTMGTLRTDGNWSRSPGFEIVCSIPIEDVDRVIEAASKVFLEHQERDHEEKE